VTERWYENTSKYGTTTSKHHGQTHPQVERTTGMVVEDMIKIAGGGITAIIGGMKYTTIIGQSSTWAEVLA
jgi:hypothetical protein